MRKINYYDEKAKIFLTNGEKAVDFLRFDRTMIPEYMRQHPMWSVKNEHMDSINMDIADFLEDPYYGPWYKEMEVPNVYLCMNGISSPVMPKFSNRVFV
jgi:hypothetical protein